MNSRVLDFVAAREKKAAEINLLSSYDEKDPTERNVLTAIRDSIEANFFNNQKDGGIANVDSGIIDLFKNTGLFDRMDVSNTGYIQEEIDYTTDLTMPRVVSVNRAVCRDTVIDINGKMVFDNLNIYLVYINYEVTGMVLFRKEINILSMEYVGHALVKINYEVNLGHNTPSRHSTYFSLRLTPQYLPVNASFFSRIHPPAENSKFDGHFKFKTGIDHQNDYYGKYSYGQYRQLKDFKLAVDQEAATGEVIIKNIIDEQNKDHVFSFTLDRPMRLIKANLLRIPGKPDNVMPASGVIDVDVIRGYKENYLIEFIMESRECRDIHRFYNLLIDNNGMQLFETEMVNSTIIEPEKVTALPCYSEFNDVETFAPFTIDLNMLHEVAVLSDIPFIMNENASDFYKSQFYGTSGINSYGYLIIHEPSGKTSYTAIYTRSKSGYRLAEVYCFKDIEDLQVSPGIVNYQLNYLVHYISNNKEVCSVGSFMVQQGDIYSMC